MIKKDTIKVFGTKTTRKAAFDRLVNAGLLEGETEEEMTTRLKAEVDKTFDGSIAETNIDWDSDEAVRDWLMTNVTLWNCDSPAKFADRVNKHLKDRLRARYKAGTSTKVTVKQIEAFILGCDDESLAEYQRLIREKDVEKAYELVRSFS